MRKNYGLPYKGSKNRLAMRIVDLLPPATNLVDMFCGGCAITHAAIESGKYSNILFNDINGLMPKLFLDAIGGKYRDEDRWISREDFFALKDTDGYVACCWSFGNNLRTYMFGESAERLKRAVHYAIFYGDYAPAAELGLDLSFCDAYGSKYAKIIAIKKYIKEFNGERIERLQSLEALERLQSLERLERLQSIASTPSNNIVLSNKDYREVEIPTDSVIYCDIPYIGTGEYLVPFDHEAFYAWALSQTQPIFISSYSMPDDFECIAEWSHRSTLCPISNNGVVEKLFTPKHQNNLHIKK